MPSVFKSIMVAAILMLGMGAQAAEVSYNRPTSCNDLLSGGSSLIKLSLRGIGLDSGLADFVDGSLSGPDFTHNIAARVESREDSTRVIRMLNGLGSVKYDTDFEGNAYRIQIKIGAKSEHLKNLEYLAERIQENDGYITPTIVNDARRFGMPVLRPTQINFHFDEVKTFSNTNLDFVDATNINERKRKTPGVSLTTFWGEVHNVDDGQRIIKMFNGLASIYIPAGSGGDFDRPQVLISATKENLSKLKYLRALVRQHGNLINEDMIDTARNSSARKR